MSKHKYKQCSLRIEVKLKGHAIKRFRERFLGFEWKPRQAGNLNAEISEIILKLFNTAQPYAKAQHNTLVYYADWRNTDGEKVDVYIVVKRSKKGPCISTFITEDTAKRYFKQGKWKNIWEGNGSRKRERRKECGQQLYR